MALKKSRKNFIRERWNYLQEMVNFIESTGNGTFNWKFNQHFVQSIDSIAVRDNIGIHVEGYIKTLKPFLENQSSKKEMWFGLMIYQKFVIIPELILMDIF